MARKANLSLELRAETDRLYYSDREKFKRLIVWVQQGKKHGWTEPEMTECLRRFWDYRAIEDWYPYLDETLEDVRKDRNADEFLKQHEKTKKEMEDWSKTVRNGNDPVLKLVKGLADAKKV